MHRISRLISKYLLTTVVPYFALIWLLLSVVMFVQQASRFSEIFFNINIPASLAWQLTLALLPNVVAFTCPVALLVGTVIGLSKMQGDSELVAIRAAGIGNWQIAVPIIVLGVLGSVFAFVVNLKGVPLATMLVRRIALETAIKKLESPLEPGVINTELAGFVIYVADGDAEAGHWRDIFIQANEQNGERQRLITARTGRIDTSEQSSELVLNDAIVWNVPKSADIAGETAVENLGEVRLAIKTKREELIAQLNRSGLRPEALGLQQLDANGRELSAREAVERDVLWYRRLLLSATPLIFCILGTFTVLRFSRGRGFGVAVSLAMLVGFYVLTFLGEQLVRSGIAPPVVGPLVPVLGCAMAVWWFAHLRGGALWDRLAGTLGAVAGQVTGVRARLRMRDLFVDLTTGLRDFDLVRSILKNLALALGFLLALFFIFTALDLWRSAADIDGGIFVLLKYLLFLVPYVVVQVIPSAAMIAMVATYAIKSRQNELVTWASAGQSVYRLLVPGFAVMLAIGGAAWVIQETVLPAANRIQDETRRFILDDGRPLDNRGRIWSRGDGRLYSFMVASDNEEARTPNGAARSTDVRIYELAADKRQLERLYEANRAVWSSGRVDLQGVHVLEREGGQLVKSDLAAATTNESVDPFASLPTRPSHLSSKELRRKLARSDSEAEARAIEVPLQRRYSTLFLPLIIALFTSPLAVTMVPRGRVAGLGSAVGSWLVFTGVVTVFEQFGLNGQLSPTLAVWVPLMLFALLGIFLLSRVRT